jgi:hypothetical protein
MVLLVVEDSLRYSGGKPPDLWRLTSILSLYDRKTNAILTRDSSQGGRRRAPRPVDRRNRPLVAATRRTLRDRADAALINQWLSEQATTPRTPKAPAA